MTNITSFIFDLKKKKEEEYSDSIFCASRELDRAKKGSFTV